MSELKRDDDRPQSLIERWLEDEDGFGLADGSPIPDDDSEEIEE